MSNATTPPLQGDMLLLYQLELVTPTTVAGTLYGIAFTLFCLYVHSLASRLRSGDRKRQAKFMLVYSIVVMLCGLYSLVFNTWVTQEGYIEHRNDLRGPFVVYQRSSVRSHPAMVVDFACRTVIDILTSAIQVWRVWVVWSATRYANFVAMLPTLCFLTFSALELRSLILQTTLPIAKVVQLDHKTLTMEIAFQAATPILCTMLISLYLIFRQWQQRKLFGKTLEGSTGYMSIAAMIIESYALESVWLLLVAILLQDPVAVFLNGSVYYIEIIAYLLVQYRVASGKAYKSQRGRSNISSLRWNHSNHATTQFEETGEIRGHPRVSAVPETSNAPRVSSMA